MLTPAACIDTAQASLDSLAEQAFDDQCTGANPRYVSGGQGRGGSTGRTRRRAHSAVGFNNAGSGDRRRSLPTPLTCPCAPHPPPPPRAPRSR